MSEPNLPSGVDPSTNLQLQGGAAIVAPVSAFPGGVPGNALVVLPLSKPSDELLESIKKGPVALEVEQMWKMLGFNGPAVQVQDAEGRPIAIGLEDLLGGLDKHWQENNSDVSRGRLYAQELIKYGRFEQAEKVLGRLVALGGTGDDWLALGIAQLQQEKWDKAEATLKGAQNLLTQNPFPTLHLAKVYQGKNDPKKERETIEAAIKIEPNAVDAWAYLYSHVRQAETEDAAIAAVTALAGSQNREVKQFAIERSRAVAQYLQQQQQQLTAGGAGGPAGAVRRA